MFKLLVYNCVFAAVHIAIASAEGFLIKLHKLDDFKQLDAAKLVKIAICGHIIAFAVHVLFAIKNSTLVNSIQMLYVNTWRVLLHSFVDSITFLCIILFLHDMDHISTGFTFFALWAMNTLNEKELLLSTNKENSASCFAVFSDSLCLYISIFIVIIVMVTKNLVLSFQNDPNFHYTDDFIVHLACIIISVLGFFKYMIKFNVVSAISTLQDAKNDIMFRKLEEGEKANMQDDNDNLMFDSEILRTVVKSDTMFYGLTLLLSSILSICLTALYIF